MKINQELRPVVDKRKQGVKQVKKDTAPFSTLVQGEAAKLQTEALDRLFSAIAKQGNRLAQSRSLHDFVLFKQHVQRFVKEAVHFGMALKQSLNWHHHGGAKTLKRVEDIDKKLTEMTQTLLQKEKRSVDLLDQIGEIKGLLINLYR